MHEGKAVVVFTTLLIPISILIESLLYDVKGIYMCGSVSDKYMSNSVCSNNKDVPQRMISILMNYYIVICMFL